MAQDYERRAFDSTDISQLRVTNKGLEKIGRWNVFGRLLRRIIHKEAKDEAVVAQMQEVLRSRGITSIKSPTETRSIKDLTVDSAQKLLQGQFIVSVQPPIVISEGEKVTIEFGEQQFILAREDAKKIPLFRNFMEDVAILEPIPVLGSHSSITTESITDALRYIVHGTPIPQERLMSAIITLDYMLVDVEVLKRLSPITGQLPNPKSFELFANNWLELPKSVRPQLKPFELICIFKNVSYDKLTSPKAKEFWKLIHEVHIDWRFDSWTKPPLKLLTLSTKAEIHGAITFLNYFSDVPVKISYSCLSNNVFHVLDNISNKVHVSLGIRSVPKYLKEAFREMFFTGDLLYDRPAFSKLCKYLERSSNVESVEFCGPMDDPRAVDRLMNILAKTPSKIHSVKIRDIVKCCVSKKAYALIS